MLNDLIKEVRASGDLEKGIFLQRFFKTGEGQYGHGDKFLGLTVPQSRVIAKKYQTLPLPEVEKLLHSDIHEDRLIALIILTIQYKKGTSELQKEIYNLYLANTKHINNWDLVDLSAEYIVGEYLRNAADVQPSSHSGAEPSEDVESQNELRSSRAKALQDDTLTKLAKSSSLWERRIAIISTFAWIKKGESKPTFEIAEILLHDKEDLIHKAVGWMLREVGKRVSEKDEEDFLRTRYKTMPRTMLRYAIERFPDEKRKAYLQGIL